MKIELEKPFSEKWRKGYIVKNPENRQNVILYNSDQDRKTISLARYNMGVKLGHEVPANVQVDHIDNDKTNDSIENLQLLSPGDNRAKEEQRYRDEDQCLYGYECNYCGARFLLTASKRSTRIFSGSVLAFCSNKCSIYYQQDNKIGIYSDTYSNGTVASRMSEDTITQIKNLHVKGLIAREIAEELSICENTVRKYW